MKHFFLILSLMAFAFSIMAFLGVNGSDAGSGVLALIGICTTLIVGVNVVDVLRVQKLEEQIDDLQDLKELKTELTGLKHNANIALNITWGLSFLNMNPKKAIQNAWKAVNLSLLANDPQRTNTSMNVVKFLLSSIKQNAKLSDSFRSECKQRRPIEITEEMNHSDLYKLVEDKLYGYIKCIDEIIYTETQ